MNYKINQVIFKRNHSYSMEDITKNFHQSSRLSYEEIIEIYKAMIEKDLKIINTSCKYYKKTKDEFIEEIKDCQAEIKRIQNIGNENAVKEIKSINENVCVVYGD